jgi:hypothetical protein
MEKVQEPRGRETLAVEIRYRGNGEETADREDSVCAVVSCRVLLSK